METGASRRTGLIELGATAPSVEEKAVRRVAGSFLGALAVAVPRRIHTVQLRSNPSNAGAEGEASRLETA